jgi:hypothetical protein
MLLLVLASAVSLESESRGTQDHILLSQFLRPPQSIGRGPRIYIPQEQGGPDMPPGTRFFFCRLLRPASTRDIPTAVAVAVQLIYDRQSVGQFVLVSGAHLGPVNNFSFSLKFCLDSCGFVIL